MQPALFSASFRRLASRRGGGWSLTSKKRPVEPVPPQKDDEDLVSRIEGNVLSSFARDYLPKDSPQGAVPTRTNSSNTNSSASDDGFFIADDTWWNEMDDVTAHLRTNPTLRNDGKFSQLPLNPERKAEIERFWQTSERLIAVADEMKQKAMWEKDGGCANEPLRFSVLSRMHHSVAAEDYVAFATNPLATPSTALGEGENAFRDSGVGGGTVETDLALRASFTAMESIRSPSDAEKASHNARKQNPGRRVLQEVVDSNGKLDVPQPTPGLLIGALEPYSAAFRRRIVRERHVVRLARRALAALERRYDPRGGIRISRLVSALPAFARATIVGESEHVVTRLLNSKNPEMDYPFEKRWFNGDRRDAATTFLTKYHGVGFHHNRYEWFWPVLDYEFHEYCFRRLKCNPRYNLRFPLMKGELIQRAIFALLLDHGFMENYNELDRRHSVQRPTSFVKSYLDQGSNAAHRAHYLTNIAIRTAIASKMLKTKNGWVPEQEGRFSLCEQCVDALEYRGVYSVDEIKKHLPVMIAAYDEVLRCGGEEARYNAEGSGQWRHLLTDYY